MQPENILLYVGLHMLFFGAAAGWVGKRRNMGPQTAAVLGAALGFIGLLIVLFSRRKSILAIIDEIDRYKLLFDKGIITEQEYLQLKRATIRENR